MSKPHFPRTQRYLEKPEHLPRYYSAVDELADGIAELIEKLVLCHCVGRDPTDDILSALKTRHSNFDLDLSCVISGAGAKP
jgi:hypothetical protein